MRRGKVAAKGSTVIFWRLAGGAEDELLALRVLLFDLDAIFGRSHIGLEPPSALRIMFFDGLTNGAFSAGTKAHNIYLSVMD